MFPSPRWSRREVIKKKKKKTSHTLAHACASMAKAPSPSSHNGWQQGSWTEGFPARIERKKSLFGCVRKWILTHTYGSTYYSTVET